MIRPIISYGALVWCKALEKKSHNNLLKQIQNMALSMFTGTMKSTPVASIEILLNVRPIELFLKEKAILTAKRLQMTGQ